MKIKKLEFENIEDGSVGAMTAFGFYEICQEPGERIVMTLNELDINWEAETIEDAKRIVQGDFEARVNDCIELES